MRVPQMHKWLTRGKQSMTTQTVYWSVWDTVLPPRQCTSRTVTVNCNCSQWTIHYCIVLVWLRHPASKTMPVWHSGSFTFSNIYIEFSLSGKPWLRDKFAHLIIAWDKDPPVPWGFSPLQNGRPHQTTVVQPFCHKPAGHAWWWWLIKQLQVYRKPFGPLHFVLREAIARKFRTLTVFDIYISE